MKRDDVKRFSAAFSGLTTAYGKTVLDGHTSRAGKVEATCYMVREELTEEVYKKHLEGKQGLAVVPINNDSLCRYGALDIDSYDLDHNKLVALIEQLKLPLILCRSKSGGGHAYLFLDDWVPAKQLREYLAEIAAAIGHAKAEIFPKQDVVLVERGDIGSHLNLPYFKHEETMRYAFNKDGEAMSLGEFLDEVDSKRTTFSEVEKIEISAPREQFPDGPPCIQNKVMEGPVTNDRNKVLFAMAVYARQKFGSDWKTAVEDMNARYMKPPLPASEVLALQRQQEKKDYFYQCTQEPLASYCNKALCKLRKFGVGNNDLPPAEISGMTILLSDPKLIFLDVAGGGRIEASMEDLQNQMRFQRLCMDQLFFAPGRMKEQDWLQIVNKLLSTAVKIPVPEELTNYGQFYEIVQDYCTSRIRALEPAELLLGKPWTEDGKTMFTMGGLMEFLHQNNFKDYTRVQVQEKLKEMNGGKECHGHKSVKRRDGSRSTLRIWWVLEFGNSPIDMGTAKHEEEVPF